MRVDSYLNKPVPEDARYVRRFGLYDALFTFGTFVLLVDGYSRLVKGGYDKKEKDKKEVV